jgi:hypothetical protein
MRVILAFAVPYQELATVGLVFQLTALPCGIISVGRYEKIAICFYNPPAAYNYVDRAIFAG